MSGPIEVIRHEGWAQLRIDREDKRNAMDRASRQGLLRTFEELRG
jgi:enoyl-CoA hydratase/carnithine racemase